MGLGMKLVKSLAKNIGKPARTEPRIKFDLFEDDMRTSGSKTAPDTVAQKQEALLAAYKKPEPVVEKPVTYDPEETKKKVTYTEEQAYGNSVLASFILFLYIAKADGVISPLEARELNDFVSMARTNPNIPPKFRGSFTYDMWNTSMTFEEVKRYLDKVHADTLKSILSRVQFFAELDGVSENEKTAVDALKLYVDQRIDKMTGKARAMDLVCPTCGGKLKLDSTRNSVTCQYCGFQKILDIAKL